LLHGLQLLEPWGLLELVMNRHMGSMVIPWMGLHWGWHPGHGCHN
jgi:hypothetical protein